jgi:hypothetical protein
VNYRPADERIRLWDTWFCEHGGEGHLFYLSGADGGWDGIGHAVSGDLLHWRERPRIVVRSADPSAWDGGDILSGNVFRLGGRWGMTYGAKHRSVQMNGLLVSDDLDRWEKAAASPALALPKAVRFGNRGRMTLAPWNGIDRLETGPAMTDASRATLHGCKGFTVGSLRAGDRGLRLRAEHGIATAWLPGTWGDLRLRAGLRFLGCGRAGVLLRTVVAGGLSLAVAFIIDLRRGEVQVGTAQRIEFELLHFEVRHRARLRPGERRGIELEAVARSEGFDWFVDGAHLFTSVQEGSTAGPVGVFVDGGALEVGGLRLVPLLPEPVPGC